MTEIVGCKRKKALEEYKEELLHEESKAIDELVSYTHGAGGE